MKHIQKLLHFVKPYWRRSFVALVLLIAVVLMDLSIPRLIQRVIDQGINWGKRTGGDQHNDHYAGYLSLANLVCDCQ